MDKKERNFLYINEVFSRPAGVFSIRNKENGKQFISSGKDMVSTFKRYMFELKNKSSKIEELQKDYDQYGEAAFEYVVLEEMARKGEKEDYYDDLKSFLLEENKLNAQVRKKEEQYIEELQPFEERGYHTPKKKKNIVKTKKRINEKKSLESNLFWTADIEEIKQGYKQIDNYYVCIVCGEKFEDGAIYKKDNQFYEAKKMIQEHMKDTHESVFKVLVNAHKKYNGVSDIQGKLMIDFYDGKTDEEIAYEEGLAKSTIRNHRFRLKEKQRQAKIFLALMDLMEERTGGGSKEMVGNEFEFQEKIESKYIDRRGYIEKLPKNRQERTVIYEYLKKQFEIGVEYTEEEINSIVKNYHHDYARVRRDMVEMGYFQREEEGSIYWL